MFYISSSKKDLEDYNNIIAQGEGYDMKHTKKYSNITKHPSLELYAILKHPDYNIEKETIQHLDNGWFDIDI